ncbi:MAG: hypothetical protein J07HX64_00802 [halophilic archaeon J07HX64]|nr:MAG: hypothetical protein J07HX64_00802 [halophilic archaeon J07HX64]
MTNPGRNSEAVTLQSRLQREYITGN